MDSSVIIGREREFSQLVSALGDPMTRTVIVRGGAGQGKTSLVLEAAKATRGTLVGYGKHADDESGSGLRALGEALRMLLEQGLEQLYDPKQGLISLRQTLGASAPALTTLDPDLFADIVSDPGPQISSGAAVERLFLAIERFLEWVQGFEQRLVLVLDDWGRAAGSTRELYGRLAASSSGKAIFIGVERESEPSRIAADVVVPLPAMSAIGLRAITASHLDGDDVMAALLITEFGDVLATPLQLVQSLALLAESGALAPRQGCWAFDRGAAAAVLGPDAAVSLLRRSVRTSPQLGRLLEIIVVSGDRASLEDVAAVAGLSSASADEAANGPMAQGLVEKVGHDLRVVHDTIRAAVLADLDDADRADISIRWAERLARSGGLRGSRLETALRLRLGGGLEQAAPSTWIALFIAGAAAARASGAPARARTYASAALELESRQDEVSFEVAGEAARAALQAGDLRAGGEFAELMVQRGRSQEERVLAAETAMLAARLSGHPLEAVRIGRTAIGEAGLKTPARAGAPEMIAAVLRLRLTSDAPSLQSRKLGSTVYRVLNTVGYMAFEHEAAMGVVLAARTAAFPPVRGTAYAAGLRAALGCLSGDWNGAIRWGRAVYDRLDRQEPLQAPAMQLSLQFGLGLEIGAERHYQECERLQTRALEEGDLGIAAYANRDRALASMRRPVSLDMHRQTLIECRALADRFEDKATGPLISALDQVAFNLVEGGEEPWRLRGDIFDSPRFEQEAGDEDLRTALVCLLMETILANAFGAWETTAAIHRRMAGRFNVMRHHPVVAVWAFHTGLARIKLGLPVARWERFAIARQSRVNADAYGHRQMVLEAETHLRRGRIAHAMTAYETALAAAEASGFWLDLGTVATAAVEAARRARRDDLVERFQHGEQRAWRKLGAHALIRGPLVEPPGSPGHAAFSHPSVRSAELSSAERASRAKTRLLAEAAHELRTPMQGIQSLLDLAADDPGILDVAKVQEAFAGLRAVVDDLTDFGAVEAERLSITEAPFDPQTLLEAEAALAQPEADRRDRRIRLDFDGQPSALLQGDAGRISQIVRNLLSNALRYGGGDVTLSLGLQRATWTVEVSDCGPGLSQADLTRLFQPFTRGDASGRADGLGLGLALSRRLAERMGGVLSGANRVGAGAVFRLELPRRAATASASAAPSARSVRVLLAEDVDLSREAMTRLLERSGHHVTAVADGEAAAAAGLAGSFDVLVFDARMPRLGGVAALARLRQAGCATPALVLSAAVDSDLAESLRDLQPVRLARKPLTAEELRTLVGIFAVREGVIEEPTPQDAIAELATREAGLIAALAAGDLDRVRELAHAAAGLAAEFELGDSEARFGAVEAAAKQSDAPAVRKALSDFPIRSPNLANEM